MSAYRIAVPEEKLVSLKIKLAQAEFPDEVGRVLCVFHSMLNGSFSARWRGLGLWCSPAVNNSNELLPSHEADEM